MSQSTGHPLAQDPGRHPAPLMLTRFIRMDMREAFHRLKVKLGLERLADVPPGLFDEPDSAIALQARELVQKLSPGFMVNHVLRTYCFGMVIAHRNHMAIDRELFYLAAVLHDLGLTDSLAEEAGSFEWVGARKAREFCLKHGLRADRADLLHDAIALHSSVCIANLREPEVSMVHYGAGCDLLGIRYGEIPQQEMDLTLARYPRQNFKQAFSVCLERQAELKPKCHIAAHMGLGMAERVQKTEFSE